VTSYLSSRTVAVLEKWQFSASRPVNKHRTASRQQKTMGAVRRSYAVHIPERQGAVSPLFEVGEVCGMGKRSTVVGRSAPLFRIIASEIDINGITDNRMARDRQ
jgi:hypothetical protein